MSTVWDRVPERSLKKRYNSKRDEMEAQRVKKAGVQQAIVKEESKQRSALSNVMKGQGRAEQEDRNVKMTIGGIRSPRLMKKNWETGYRMVCRGLRRIRDKNGNKNGRQDGSIDSPVARTRE